MTDMRAEIFFLFPDGSEVFVSTPLLPRIGETIRWAWDLYMVKDVGYAFTDLNQVKIDVLLESKESTS